MYEFQDTERQVKSTLATNDFIGQFQNANQHLDKIRANQVNFLNAGKTILCHKRHTIQQPNGLFSDKIYNIMEHTFLLKVT